MAAADASALAVLRPDVALGWLPNATGRIQVLPAQTGNGDILLRVPYRSVNDDRLAGGFRVVTVPAGWIIDLSQSGIDLGAKVGGILDGAAVAASMDYRVWALIDPWASDGDCFKGFGVTGTPTAPASTVSGTINLGANGSITVGAAAPTFTIGARAIVRASTAIGALWNQGTITGATSTTISVTADPTWLAAAENNGNLTGTVDVIQIDRFEPRILAGGSIGRNWPGDGSPWAWAYCGMVQTNAAKVVRQLRQWGDWYVPVTALSVLSATGGNGANATALGRWLPLGSERAQFTLADQSGGNGFLSVGMDIAESNLPLAAATRGGAWAMATLFRRGLVTISRTTLAGNPQYTLALVGWRPPMPW